MISYVIVYLCKNSLFPASVAQILKEEEFGDATIPVENRTLIAEAYKDVTILFADLVGFTKMSSGIKPSELVCIPHIPIV